MPETRGLTELVFLHISDIHFRKGRTDDLHDSNRMVRNEMQRDLRRLRTTLPRLDGLVVSGDVAFSGKPQEYEYAANWIESVREAVGCPSDGVMVTPGNHDMDRDLIPAGGQVCEIQRKIREGATLEERDERLAETLRDDVNGEALLRPLAAYNAFAKQYNCDITRMRPYWERIFEISDGTKVRIRGLTTTLLSGPNDNEQTHKMMYGSAQREILRYTGIREVIVGHHPPSWSIEGDVAEHAFGMLTIFQAFGHKHDQWIARSGKSVRLIAGAFHPDRSEAQWLPRYSAVSISPKDDRHITLRIHPRRWSFEELTFIPDCNLQKCDYREHVIEVEPA